MQYHAISNWLKSAVFFLFAITLSACGGGGGGGGGGFTPDNSGQDGQTLHYTVEILDSAGNALSGIPVGTIATLRIRVTEGANANNAAPVVDAVVEVDTDVGSIVPAGGTALTDADGVAELEFDPGTSQLAGTMTVQVRGRAVDGRGEVNFQVVASNLRIGRYDGATFVEGELEISTSDLPFGGATLVSFSVVNEQGEPAPTALSVVPSSFCASTEPPSATLPASVDVLNGEGSFTYAATTCVGEDRIEAALAISPDISASGTVTVEAASVGQIDFISLDNPVLALAGTGTAARPERAQVVFNVLDEAGRPAADVPVMLSLSSDTGGVALESTSAITDAVGEITAVVTSGSIPVTVVVNAEIDLQGIILSKTSDPIDVTGGRADQNSFSISQSVFSIEGGDVDGLTVEINARAADNFNNPVPEGTEVIFSPRYGNMPDKCQLDAEGNCTVSWESSDPRGPLLGSDFITDITNTPCPAYVNANPTLPAFGPCPVSLGPTSGRNTILVIADGEESYVDTNGNQAYDLGEIFQDLAEPFNDHNGDGQFNPVETPCDPYTDGLECSAGAEETYVDTNKNGVWDRGNGIYDGSACPVEADGTYCTRNSVHVRSVQPLIVPETDYYFMLTTSGDRPVGAGSTLRDGTFYNLYISDRFNNQPPAGSTVTVSAESCEVAFGPDGDEIPNGIWPGAYPTAFTMGRITDNLEPISGIVEIRVETPNGYVSETFFPCSDVANVPVEPQPQYRLVIGFETPGTVASISAPVNINVRVQGGGAGIPVSATTTSGTLQANTVATETGGIATFTFQGDKPGGVTFTAQVEDPVVGAIEESFSFNVNPDEFFIGYIAGGVASQSTIGLVPALIDISVVNTVRVIVDVMDAGGVRATGYTAEDVQVLLTCSSVGTDLITAPFVNGRAEIAAYPIPGGCGSSALFRAVVNDPQILNPSPPSATLTIQ